MVIAGNGDDVAAPVEGMFVVDLALNGGSIHRNDNYNESDMSVSEKKKTTK